MASFGGRINHLALGASRLTKLKNAKVLQNICQPHVALISSGTGVTRRPQLTKEVLSNINLASTSSENNSLKLKFTDGSVGAAPFLWLRDNCQCPQCFDKDALARKFLFHDLDTNIKPKEMWSKDKTFYICWNDGHQSEFDAGWLYERAFTPEATKAYKSFYKLEQTLWGKDLDLDSFDYNTLMKDEKSLLDYLMVLERKGGVLVKNAPLLEAQGAALADHIAYVKPSHFGPRSPVQIRKNPSNLGFSCNALGLHNDIPQYEYQAGLIFLHMIEQHIGEGGSTVIADGIYCGEIMRQKYPKEFELLTTTDVYFWDKGKRGYYLEMESFHKIHRGPIISLDNGGRIEKLSVNNQVRDSHLDLPHEEVHSFYKAMKILHNILYENCYELKMENGDMLTLDNVRCLHGREGFKGSSSRHLESTYMDWDEVRCRRRLLQEKYL